MYIAAEKVLRLKVVVRRKRDGSKGGWVVRSGNLVYILVVIILVIVALLLLSRLL